GSKLINARGETVHEKPSFRAAFKRRRCLIPADGFFEWHQRDDDKVPMYIHKQDRSVFAMAGLWEIWSRDGNDIYSCTIITTEANDFMKQYHHRMPVILHEEDYATWLSPDEEPTPVLRELIRPYEADAFAAYQVSKVVNKPANDLPACIEPVT
ncbi:MAG: SOS response-associated peptidase, partial [Chloroflexi bacterium]